METIKAIKLLLKGFFFGTKPENVSKSLVQANNELQHEIDYLRKYLDKYKTNMGILAKRNNSLTWKVKQLETNI